MLSRQVPAARCGLTRPLVPTHRRAIVHIGASRLRAHAAAAIEAAEERSALSAVLGFVLHGARVGGTKSLLHDPLEPTTSLLSSVLCRAQVTLFAATVALTATIARPPPQQAAQVGHVHTVFGRVMSRNSNRLRCTPCCTFHQDVAPQAIVLAPGSPSQTAAESPQHPKVHLSRHELGWGSGKPCAGVEINSINRAESLHMEQATA